jgi:hypothetical protein
MSIYRDTNATVTFEHPYPGPLVATVFRAGELIFTSPPLMPTAGRYSLNLTYVQTQYDGALDITWTDGVAPDLFIRTTTEKVITPLVSLSKLRTLFSDTNWQDPELMELENSVRVFIESYTQQTFGYEVGTMYVVGNGEKRISLPKHMITLTDVNIAAPGFFWLSNDGWYLNTESKSFLDIKEAPPEEFMDNTVYMTHGVIVVPDAYWRKFRTGHEYAITGEWGYYSVPEDVQEAAALLANDIACGDSLYRDRYVATINPGTGNTLSFDRRAYDGTGNARVDKLLEPYMRDGMVII